MTKPGPSGSEPTRDCAGESARLRAGLASPCDGDTASFNSAASSKDVPRNMSASRSVDIDVKNGERQSRNPLSQSRPSKQRLEELIALAQAYRGWSRNQLATQLGRDSHNLIPPSGVPRLDLVVELAKVLDWPVDQLIADIYGQSNAPREAPLGTWRELDEAAYEAYLAGNTRECLDLAEQALDCATCPRERAWALHRITNCWDRLGQFTRSIEAARLGLKEVPIPEEIEFNLRMHLANAYYALGETQEARSLAFVLLDDISRRAPGTDGFAHQRAAAQYVLGNCHRVLAGMPGPDREHHARMAVTQLDGASHAARRVARRFKDENYAAMAETCEWAAVEMRVMLGELEPMEIVQRGMSRLDEPTDNDHWLEARGWTCIHIANIAFRHVTDSDKLQHILAVVTNKADEIADQLGNWSLREQVWMIEHMRRRAVEGAEHEEWLMDREDLKIVAGVMARFPAFRETGWQILRTSRVVEENVEGSA